MGAVAIILGLGICVFLLWFFESIQRDFFQDNSNQIRYTDTRSNNSRSDSRSVGQTMRVIHRQQPLTQVRHPQMKHPQMKQPQVRQPQITAYEQSSQRRAS